MVMHAGVRLGSNRVSMAGAIAGLDHVDTGKASEISKKLSVLTGYVPDSRAITERRIWHDPALCAGVRLVPDGDSQAGEVAGLGQCGLHQGQ